MNITHQIISRIREICGIDFHILATLLFRGWGVLAGLATVLLLPLYLSPSEQGYYFTFASVIAIQVFFELGFNQIIVQLVSHEVANLGKVTISNSGGRDADLSRLNSLLRLTQRWYSVSASLFIMTVSIVGIVFFGEKNALSASTWLGPWIVLVIATGANLLLSPRLAVIEGLGRVGQVARLRLVQSMAGSAFFFLLLIFGGGLWAATAVPIIAAICTGYWLNAHQNSLCKLNEAKIGAKNQINWFRDVFPFQWRIAISWMSGYLIFSLFTPMIFSHQGSIEAGKLGMALAIFGAILSIGMSWVNAKSPDLTMHIARGERAQLNGLFKALFIRSTSFVALSCSAFVLMAYYLHVIGLPLIGRLASTDILIVLAVATTSNSAISAMATYMRAHLEEPMLLQSVISGILVSCIAFFTSAYSTFLMMFLYMLISLISLLWTLWIFSKYYRRDHVGIKQ